MSRDFLFVVLYILVKLDESFLEAVLHELDFRLICAEGLEVHMNLISEDLPALEVQLLRLAKQLCGLVDIVRKAFQCSVFI